MTDSLSRAQARRIALAAQGFLDPRPAVPTMRTFQRTLQRTGVLQVDSVNVLQRAHYMPLWSRMGAYDTDLLRRASEQRPRRVVEYWAHVQALMPVELWPHMAHRRAHYRARRGKWSVLEENPGLEADVLARLAAHGAATARQVAGWRGDAGPESRDHWGWNWSSTRRVLDYLFTTGEVAIAGRTRQFEVLYDLPERVLPPEVLALPTPPVAEQHLELVRRAARSHGVATQRCLIDYYRMHVDQVRPAVETLVESGELLPVAVEGWARPAYLHVGARRPRAVRARALLSPFDPLVWERERTERLFDFHYRIEIYVPAHLRRHGYYVLPFLLGDEIVARVDLKADRRAAGGAGLLRVPAAWAEPGAPEETAAELAAELRALAGWLGLADVVVGELGDLAGELRSALAG
ncbi:winged helix-turn-helix domain-containing protein [Nocardioides sp. Leaf307]|uniref:winged helix-turn-helix domain-containing protein n=1 Tax=Nocardioides sp. Leaf307 TaxID=1736331 RepID=UPI000AFEFF02|nr:crosslink repair DNA glycosylase YcaQ family protein [Nocardioides sp. Leaf307]